MDKEENDKWRKNDIQTSNHHAFGAANNQFRIERRKNR